MLVRSSLGSIENPALVFLHGFLGTGADWDEVIKHLKSRFFCIAVALPGHGSSFSADFPGALTQTLRDYGVHKAALVGYSMGGRLALDAASKHPSLFTQVIALSAHPGLRNEQEKKRRAEDELKWERLLKTLSIEQFLEIWYAQPLFASLKKREPLFSEIIERRCQHNPQALAAAMRLFSPVHQHINIPESALFLCGEDDLKYRELYHTLLPKIRTRMLAGCGHALHLEDPKACADTIEEILCTSKQ